MGKSITPVGVSSAQQASLSSPSTTAPESEDEQAPAPKKRASGLDLLRLAKVSKSKPGHLPSYKTADRPLRDVLAFWIGNVVRNAGGTEMCYAVRTKRSYGAETTLAAFSEALRSEAEFERVREHLLGAVEDMVRPTHEPLCLRQRGAGERR